MVITYTRLFVMCSIIFSLSEVFSLFYAIRIVGEFKTLLSSDSSLYVFMKNKLRLQCIPVHTSAYLCIPVNFLIKSSLLCKVRPSKTFWLRHFNWRTDNDEIPRGRNVRQKCTKDRP